MHILMIFENMIAYFCVKSLPLQSVYLVKLRLLYTMHGILVVF